MNYAGPGIYRHYKGGEYEVLGLGFGEAGKEEGKLPHNRQHQTVVYRPLSPGSILEGTDVTFWLRDLEDFDGTVPTGPGLPNERRFEKIGELS